MREFKRAIKDVEQDIKVDDTADKDKKN